MMVTSASGAEVQEMHTSPAFCVVEARLLAWTSVPSKAGAMLSMEDMEPPSGVLVMRRLKGKLLVDVRTAHSNA